MPSEDFDAPEKTENTEERRSLVSGDHEDPTTVDEKGSLCHRLFNRIEVYTACHSLTAFIVSCSVVYLVAQITALERQFKLSSSQTGFMVASIDFGIFSTSLFIGYFANKVHVPRVIGISTLVVGLTTIQTSLPHFIYGFNSTELFSKENINDNLSANNPAHLCQSENQSDYSQCSTVEEMEDANKNAIERTISFWIINSATIISGFALAPRYPFFVSFIETNAKKSQSGFFLGIALAAWTIGGFVAFGFSGVFSSLHVSLQEVDIEPLHPRWIGAWWLGYLVFGCLCVMISIPLFFFPKKLKTAKPREEEEEKNDQTNLTLLNHVKAYFIVIRKLVKNPIYVFSELCIIVNTFTGAGKTVFFPKYIEVQYYISAWKANTFTSIVIACAALGSLLGGWITSRKGMTPTRNLKCTIFILILCCLLEICGFFLGCDYYDFSQTLKADDEIMSCGDNCQCNNLNYFPVCGDDVHYYSPCYAGCSVRSAKIYKNCSCIESGQAQEGLCARDCTMYFALFLVTRFIKEIAIAVCFVTNLMLVIRSIEESEKSMGVGVGEFFCSVLGWLPAPMVFGKLVDSVCDIWDRTCEDDGSCLLYDLPKFRYVYIGMQLAGQFTALCFAFITLYFRLKRDRIESETVKEAKEMVQLTEK